MHMNTFFFCPMESAPRFTSDDISKHARHFSINSMLKLG